MTKVIECDHNASDNAEEIKEEKFAKHTLDGVMVTLRQYDKIPLHGFPNMNGTLYTLSRSFHKPFVPEYTSIDGD